MLLHHLSQTHTRGVGVGELPSKIMAARTAKIVNQLWNPILKDKLLFFFFVWKSEKQLLWTVSEIFLFFFACLFSAQYVTSAGEI